jgi:hypothetical protein
MTLSFFDIVIIFLINYLMIVPVFYALFKSKIESLHYIVASKSPKNRITISKRKHSIKSRLLWCFVWPYYVIKIKNEEIEKRK